MRTFAALFISLILLTTPALQAKDDFERVRESLSQGKYAKAAKELQRIAIDGGASLKKPEPEDEKMLRGAIDTARKSLENGTPAERNAARQVLCLSRAYFPEEDLPGTEQALQVGEGVQRPEILNEPVRSAPPKTGIAGLWGTVIVELIVDQEGCARHPRVLKGLPKGSGNALLTAIQSWTFQPATLEGRPVPVYYVLTVSSH